MNKKILFFSVTVLLLLFIPFMSALLDSLGTFKQGGTVRISQVCSDATYINLSSVSYPNSTSAVTNIEMTSSGSGEYYYDFNLTNTIGRYDVRGISDGCENTFATYFEVTYSGLQITEGRATLYIGFLAMLILVLVVNFVGIGYLPSSNTKDEDGRILSISYLKYFRNVLWMTGYFLFIGIIYLASNLAFAFLQEEMLAQTLFMIFRVSFGVAPLIVIAWIVWIFVSMFHDKQFQQMLNRGVFPQGKL